MNKPNKLVKYLSCLISNVDGNNSPKHASKSITCTSPIVVTEAGDHKVNKTASPLNRPSFLVEAGFTDDPIEMGIELGSECKETKATTTAELFKKSQSPRISACRKSPPNSSHKPLKTSAIPEISYSRWLNIDSTLFSINLDEFSAYPSWWLLCWAQT